MAELTAKQKKVAAVTSMGSSIGLVAGLVYSFKNKKKFWGYVGFGLLGSIVLGTIAGVGSNMIVKDDFGSKPAETPEKKV